MGTFSWTYFNVCILLTYNLMKFQKKVSKICRSLAHYLFLILSVFYPVSLVHSNINNKYVKLNTLFFVMISFCFSPILHRSVLFLRYNIRSNPDHNIKYRHKLTRIKNIFDNNQLCIQMTIST